MKADILLRAVEALAKLYMSENFLGVPLKFSAMLKRRFTVLLCGLCNRKHNCVCGFSYCLLIMKADILVRAVEALAKLYMS